MIVKAKLIISSKELFPDGSARINMMAVTDGSEENKTYAKYTPWAEFKMQVTVPEVAALFVPGDKLVIEMELTDHNAPEAPGIPPTS